MKDTSIIKKISSIFHSWDPIGYTPDDEYDDLSLKLFNWIRHGHSEEEIFSNVNDYLKNYIGLADVDQKKLTEIISMVLKMYSDNTGTDKN